MRIPEAASGGQFSLPRRYEGAPATTGLARICPRENILLDVPIESPNQLFEHAALHIQNRHGYSAERIKSRLTERERLGSTGLGQGVAIPHARVGGIRSAVGLFIRALYPFVFNAPDRKPVGEFIVLVIPEEDNREHLELLADAARLFGDRSFRMASRAAQTPDDIRRLMQRAR
ncbi:PTS sugar transporter subunit IIA [Burkholderia sp. MR1-5-21]